MSRFVTLVLLGLLLGSGCAASMQGIVSHDSAPDLVIEVLRKDPATAELRPLTSADVLGVDEEAVLDIRFHRPAYVTVVLYAAVGKSVNLTESQTKSPLPAGQSLRVTIPRVAPPGVKEPELRIVVAASLSPPSPMLQQLLRLPCDAQGGRGDPEPSKDRKDSSSGSKEKGTSSSSRGETGKPPPREPRGGTTVASVCTSPPGLTAPVTLRALVLRSQ